MKKLLIVTTLAAGTFVLKADEAIFQASLTPDIAIHARTTQINGLSLNIWGENPQYSLNVGFVNGSTGDSEGLAWGLVFPALIRSLRSVHFTLIAKVFRLVSLNMTL